MQPPRATVPALLFRPISRGVWRADPSVNVAIVIEAKPPKKATYSIGLGGEMVSCKEIESEVSTMNAIETARKQGVEAWLIACGLKLESEKPRYVARPRQPGTTTPNESVFINEKFAREYADDCNEGRKQFHADDACSPNPWGVYDTELEPVSKFDKATRVLLNRGEYRRASGDVICTHCQCEYREHQEIRGFPTLHILCNGDLVKL